MINLKTREKVIAGVSLVVICFAGGILFSRLYQTPHKTMLIYKDALADYRKEDYSNSYYLFSRVSAMSELKPAALYRQAACASAIGDKESALKKYRTLYSHYAKNPLSPRAKYLAAQIFFENNDLKHASKCFKQLMKEAPASDYAIASEYYLGLILMKKYTDSENSIFPLSAKQDVENYFRHYLEKAPKGRLAPNVIDNWLSIDKTISPDDYLLMAESLYQLGEYPRAKDMLQNTNDAEAWVLKAEVLNVTGHKDEALSMLQKGFDQYQSYVSEDKLIDAMNLYLSLSSMPKLDIANYFAAHVSGKVDDYAGMLKCDYSSGYDKTKCFKDFYVEYPDSKYAEKALSEIFMGTYELKDFEGAKKIGLDYLEKYRDKDSAPMIMFWMGKIFEKYRDYSAYMGMYKSVITSFPDTYYAYRAYLRLNHQQHAIITNKIKPLPVVYPYELKNPVIRKLAELEDYEIIDEIAGSNEFVKSWILYKQGDYSHSMLVARNAMDKLEEKPDKYDFRWRLVYPLHYYETIEDYADITGNNPPLMLSIAREESYFNPEAASFAGAKGLMQLMPSTAEEIARIKHLGSYDLFNAESNIKLGNYYYAYIKGMLSGHDISAVASYNGGIGSVTRWKQSLMYDDTDSFVEQIPYEETKTYVKKVFRSYWNYIRIYNVNN